MSPHSLSFWERMQLVLLRWLGVSCGAFDARFGVRWGERLVERLSGRWQTRLARIDRDLAQLEAERDRLQVQTEALAIHSAAIYLGGRCLSRGELRFDAADSRDEELLAAAIDLLVKQQLSAVRAEEVGPEHYIYHLEPDWAAIRARLAQAGDQAEPDIADWFREGLGFLDTIALSGTGPSSG